MRLEGLKQLVSTNYDVISEYFKFSMRIYTINQ